MKNKLRIYAYIFAGIIFLILLVGYLAGWLGDFPVRSAQLLTGRVAFVFLLASLSITPLRTITGNTTIGPLRKALGLNAFYFSVIHVLILVFLDYRLNFAALLEGFVFRQYFWPGAATFLILIILAVTSLNKVKKAVRTAWKKIHMLVYPAGVLALVHYSWIANGKLFPAQEFKVFPLLSAVFLAALFILRLKPVREEIIKRRKEKASS